MEKSLSSGGRSLGFAIAKAALVILLLLGAVGGCVFYLDWSAEKRATAFCNDIALGSDISVAIEKANKRNILFGSFRGYSFYFPGNMFNKAVCLVSVDQDNKVTAKHFGMEND